MKKGVWFGLILFFCLLLFSCSIPSEEYAEYLELGIPTAGSYPHNSRARCVWDMAVFEDQLFIGSGDYDTNAGPVEIWCWGISEEQWKQSGAVPDEEVSRFCFIDGCLTIPGTDPMGDWEYGNYYMLENGAWETFCAIAGGLHTFDMAEFQGMIFAGMGVKEGEYPISCSTDGGKTFSAVEMIKNGLPLETGGRQIRVYDLIPLNGELYAAFYEVDTELTYDLYRYDGERFVYEDVLLGKIHQIKYFNNIIGGKAEFGGRLFFTTGYLYVTDNMEEFLRIEFPNSENVYDLYTADGCLYILCGKLLDGGQYRVSVWKNESGENTDFEEIFAFLYDAPPLSLVRHESSFYIGMGDFNTENPKNGMVIRIDDFQ